MSKPARDLEKQHMLSLWTIPEVHSAVRVDLEDAIPEMDWYRETSDGKMRRASKSRLVNAALAWLFTRSKEERIAIYREGDRILDRHLESPTPLAFGAPAVVIGPTAREQDAEVKAKKPRRNGRKGA